MTKLLAFEIEGLKCESLKTEGPRCKNSDPDLDLRTICTQQQPARVTSVLGPVPRWSQQGIGVLTVHPESQTGGTWL